MMRVWRLSLSEAQYADTAYVLLAALTTTSAAVVYYCSSYTDLTEEEYIHILSAFLLVLDPVKMAAHNAHRDIE